MKHWRTIVVASFGMWAAVALAANGQFGEVAPKGTPTVALAELVQHADSYKGRVLQVTGTLGDLCADGDDFYFKDKFELIEVVPPRGDALPYAAKKNAPLVVYGTVNVRHRGNQVDVSIEAKGVRFP